MGVRSGAVNERAEVNEDHANGWRLSVLLLMPSEHKYSSFDVRLKRGLGGLKALLETGDR
jgi:hypothetical protein